MAKAAHTAGALLGAVTNTAEMLSNSVNTINGVVSIGNSFVSRHREMQEVKNTAELATFKKTLLKDTADSMASHNETIKAKLKDASYAASFQEAYDELSAILYPEAA